jgi:exo-beta-1,3-glucanase (GH17 family)
MRPAVSVLAACLAAFVAAAALNFVFWWAQGRPQDLPAAKTQRIRSASFSPYRSGESPFGRPFTRQELEEDMAVAAKYFSRIRIYATGAQFAPVPELARKHGLKVILGAWVGANLEDNKAEIDNAIKIANAYPDTVERVVVGNEVLLRDEVTPKLLVDYIRKVKAAVKQPVTYADVWEYWLLHPEVAREVDSITIHVLPYWENKPTPVDKTIAHMLDAVDKINRAYPGKPVLIGEIGWPSAGRQREGALPGRLAQARFVRQIINTAEERGIDFNLFELFDEDWKVNQEGTVGGNWGLVDANRRLKFPLSGPVSEKPYWFEAFLASSALALLLTALALLLRPPASPVRGAAMGAAAQLLATLLAASVEQSLALSYGVTGVAGGVLLSGGGALLALLVFSELADAAAGRGQGPEPLPPVVARLEDLRARRLPLSTRAGLIALLDLVFGLAALSFTFGLVIDARYRDFRVAQLLPVALCLLLRLFAMQRPPRPVGSPREEWIFALCFPAGAVATVVLEGGANLSAYAWGATLLALALPWAITIRRLGKARAAAA